MSAADPLNTISFVNTATAAKRMGFSTNYLAKLRIYGGGPKFSKCGAAVRYKIADIDGFMADRVHSSTSSYATTATASEGEQQAA